MRESFSYLKVELPECPFCGKTYDAEEVKRAIRLAYEDGVKEGFDRIEELEEWKRIRSTCELVIEESPGYRKTSPVDNETYRVVMKWISRMDLAEKWIRNAAPLIQAVGLDPIPHRRKEALKLWEEIPIDPSK